MAEGRTPKLFRCFCGCSELCEQEIKDIVMGRTDLVFTDARVKQMFRAYMAQFHPNHHTRSHRPGQMVLRHLLAFDICKEILEMPPEERKDSDRWEELLNNCANYSYEKMIEKAKASMDPNPDTLVECLNVYMADVKRMFSEDPHNYYEHFKEELLKKLQQK
ncbi:hypothetical protein DMENIID0001_087620 [Sergentomyia squamirostris]